MSTLNYVVFVSLLILGLIIFNNSQDIAKVVNLDSQCLRCLCYAATTCNRTNGCEKGYCGPYKISKLFWKDAGSIVLPDDDVERAGAYEDCAISYQCAQNVITNYIIKYGRDCNEDGVTDCEDYSMINFNGGFQCSPPLNHNELGSAWLKRYRTCNP